MKQEINSRLSDLYKGKWDSYLLGRTLLTEKKDLGETLDYTRPLLLGLKDEQAYLRADKRVMILGQETNGWAEGGEMTPENSMNKYVEFFGDGESVKWKGPFWNETKRFIRLLKKKFPEQIIAYTYNNVVKIGKSSGIGFPGETVYQIEMKHLDILKQEIEILKPHLLLFFSGVSYDDRIRNKLGDFSKQTVKAFAQDKLCRLHFADKKLPIAFRTHHPKAMYLQKLDRYEYLNSIIEAAFDYRKK